jgi:hypothetical protein
MASSAERLADRRLAATLGDRRLVVSLDAVG